MCKIFVDLVVVNTQRILPGTKSINFPCGVRPDMRQKIRIIPRITQSVSMQLLQIAEALYRPGLVARRFQRGQKHPGEDCDDRNYHEELYKGELLSFS